MAANGQLFREKPSSGRTALCVRTLGMPLFSSLQHSLVHVTFTVTFKHGHLGTTLTIAYLNFDMVTGVTIKDKGLGGVRRDGQISNVGQSSSSVQYLECLQTECHSTWMEVLCCSIRFKWLSSRTSVPIDIWALECHFLYSRAQPLKSALKSILLAYPKETKYL